MKRGDKREDVGVVMVKRRFCGLTFLILDHTEFG